MFSGRVLLPFITLHHICCRRKIVEKHFLTKLPNAGLAQHHIVNLLPLCHEKPLEVSHSAAAGKVGNVTLKLLSDFSYYSVFKISSLFGFKGH